MRFAKSVCFVAIFSLALTGCGGNNAKADRIANEVIAEMNKMVTALEAGDKPAIDASLAKLQTLAKESKETKVTKSKNDELKAKMDTAMKELTPRLTQAVMKAATSGKLTQADLQEIGMKMQEMGKAYN